MAELYKEYELLVSELPEMKKEAKDAFDRLSLLTATTIVGSHEPKITLQATKDTLGVSDLDDCCGKFILENIIQFSGMSPKAEEAMASFAKTKPAMTAGLAALITPGKAPTDYLDPEKKLSEYERATMDIAVMVEARKQVGLVEGNKTFLDSELDRKYAQFDEASRLWS